MVICLCGDDKSKIINELKRVYKDKLIVFNYYHTTFKTIIDTESVKYKLQDECENLNEARNIYRNYVNDIVTNKTNEFIENNKDKIIVLISDNILSHDLDKTVFFDKSDLKILIHCNDSEYKYDENKFDLIINKNENIDIKKLVKL